MTGVLVTGRREKRPGRWSLEPSRNQPGLPGAGEQGDTSSWKKQAGPAGRASGGHLARPCPDLSALASRPGGYRSAVLSFCHLGPMALAHLVWRTTGVVSEGSGQRCHPSRASTWQTAGRTHSDPRIDPQGSQTGLHGVGLGGIHLSPQNFPRHRTR